MADQITQSTKTATAKKPVPAVSGVFDHGVILEMVYRPHERQTAFIVWQHGHWTLEQRFSPDPHHCLVPYSPTNNLLQLRHDKGIIELFTVRMERFSAPNLDALEDAEKFR